MQNQYKMLKPRSLQTESNNLHLLHPKQLQGSILPPHYKKSIAFPAEFF